MSFSLEQSGILEAYRRDSKISQHGLIVGGAAMVLYGMKPKTPDIDIVLPARTLVEVMGSHLKIDPSNLTFNSRLGSLTIAKGGWDVSRPGDYGTYYNDMQLLLPPNDDLYTATYEVLMGSAQQVGGAMVISPRDLLDWKRGVNRPKDRHDVTLIETSLGLEVTNPNTTPYAFDERSVQYS